VEASSLVILKNEPWNWPRDEKDEEVGEGRGRRRRERERYGDGGEGGASTTYRPRFYRASRAIDPRIEKSQTHSGPELQSICRAANE
jgi:hypothetical protein